MAPVLHHLYSLFALVSVFSLLSSCTCFNISQDDFQPTVATFYGPQSGAGSGGGACGYGVSDLVNPPFNKFIAAGGQSLFNNGKGCGICYQVKCDSNPACSRQPITVTLADFCPPSCGASQFDLSGTAYGALALPGRAQELYKAGRLQVLYQRVGCNYGGYKITFQIDTGSNPFFFSTAIVYENGEGDLARVDFQEGSGGSFLSMQQSFGATWKINSARKLIGPFSIRITSSSGKSLLARNVIPVGWQPGQTYRSNVNF